MSALSAMGVAPGTPSFPAVVNCPLCQKPELYLFDDNLTGGIWLHCNECKTHGDIITFAAQIWNTSVPEVIRKFVDSGISARLDAEKMVGEYTRALTRLTAAERFYGKMRENVWTHDDEAMTAKMREIGIRSEVPATGDLIGVASAPEVLQLCDDLSKTKPYYLRKTGTSIVLPYYDLPGRLTGFLLLKLVDGEKLRQLFIAVTGYTRQKPHAGYFLLDTALLPAPPELKGKQFVVEDPLWALTEQCRQLRHTYKLLPLMASYQGDEAASYGTQLDSLGPATRLFQSTTVTPALISQAANGRGYVCAAPLDSSSPKNAKYTLSRLGCIYGRAATWQKTLKEELSGLGEIAAHSFAVQLTAPHEKMQAFFRNYANDFSTEFRDRVMRHITIAPAVPTKVSSKWTIIEQENSWWSHTGTLVCNARIVIQHILQSDDGSKLYSGKIFQDDWELDFTDDAKRIENIGLLAYAAAMAAPHGRLVTYDRFWNKRSHLITLQLHPPKLELISTKIGWDSATGLFRFGNYVLHNSGEVAKSESPIKTSHINFPDPAPIAPITIRQFLTPGPQSGFVWAVFATIAANLIAPIINKDCTATAVTPAGFDMAAKIGTALGCQQAQTTAVYRTKAAEFIRSQTKDSTWPVFISSMFDETLLLLATSRIHTEPVLVKTPEAGAAVALGYNWQRISGYDLPTAGIDFTVLQYVLPAYIQHVLRQRMTFMLGHRHIVVAVLHDLHKWLDNTYNTTFHLPQALRQVNTVDNAHTALMEELGRALYDKKLALLPRPRRKDESKSYLLRRKDSWWLNRRGIDNYFAESKNIPPNWLAIIDLLVNDGVFNGEESVHGMPGLLVASPWCDKFVKPKDDSAQETG